MSKKLKEKWIRALESGAYKQGQGHLYSAAYCLYGKTGGKRMGPSYCCIGVLCRQAGIRNLAYATRDIKNGRLTTGGFLTDRGLLKVGLTNAQQTKLIDMNDGNTKSPEGKTFKQIAAWIRKYI